MHPLSDKDLDRLSREAAEQYDVEQNTSGWDKLEQKLNKHLPEKGKKERRRFLFFIWAFALLSGGGLLWMLTSTQSLRTITLKEGFSELSTQRSPGESVNPASGTGRKSDKQALPNENANPQATDETHEGQPPANTNFEKTSTANIGTESAKVVSPENNTKPNLQADPLRRSISDKKGRSMKETYVRRNAVKVGNKPRKNNPSSGTDVPTSQDVTHTEPIDKKETKNAVVLNDGNKKENEQPSPVTPPTETKEKASHTDSAQNDGTAEIPGKVDSNKLVKKAADLKVNGFRKGFQVGVLVAPDMSNVKFTNTDKVGYNVGLQIGYRISQRWSLNTGVIYTKKNYTSQGKDFNPPKGSWIDNVTLDMVAGNCSMFDIPLNVRYDLNNGRSHRYFVSTGLSTYLMKKEEYHYHYQYSNGNPGYRQRSASSDEKHFLSVLNISAGFEKKISNRLSLQAEPYLKVPLAGVGYGNLQLNSYGMYFLLKLSHGNRR